MPSPETIDIDALVQPIPGDDPAGGPLPGPTAEKLKEYREEFDPADLDPDDPNRNEPKKDANWQGVIDLGEETLRDGSKHLLVAARLVEALTMKHGLPGARDGFRLLRRLSEECWDFMYPKVEEPDDLEARAATFAWLDDDKTGSLYPNKLKDIPLLVNGSARISVIAWKGAGPRLKATLTPEQVAAAARSADPARCQAITDDLDETVDEVNRLSQVLEDKMGRDLAPSFSRVREALDECRTLAQGINAQRNGQPAAGGESAVEAAGGGGPMVVTGATTREGAYRQLEAAADALARVEPHSPVPYLVKRAVQLKDIKFPDLVEQLTKDANVLAFLKRDISAEEGSS